MVDSYDEMKHKLPQKTWRTKVTFPGAKKLSLRFSRYSEVGTYDITGAEIKTTLTVESETSANSPALFAFRRRRGKASCQTNEQDLPGTPTNPEPFELPGTDSCTIVYSCAGLTWGKDPVVPVKKGFQWGWRCLVSATMDSPDISDFDLASLIDLCPNLHPNKLKHFGKGPAFCQALATHREELTDLDLRLCSAITDAALSCLPAGCPELHPDRLLSPVKGDKYLTNVGQHNLDIDNIDFAACPNVTDQGKLAVLSGCPKVVADPTVFGVMNDTVLLTIAKLRPEQTSEFNLLHYETVTDEGLAGLVAACPAVHPNDIKSVAKGERFLAAVSQKHTGLTKINLAGCRHVTDAALAELVVCCPKLMPDAIRSQRKGDAFVAAVAQHRPTLKQIDLKGCDAVTEKGLDPLVKGCPQLDPADIRVHCKGVYVATERLYLWRHTDSITLISPRLSDILPFLHPIRYNANSVCRFTTTDHASCRSKVIHRNNLIRIETMGHFQIRIECQ